MVRIDQRTYSRHTLQALILMGRLIRLARQQRRLTAADLAERVGISRGTLQRIEKGDPKVEVGLVFEAATVAGVPLFSEPGELGRHVADVQERLALLPKAVHKRATEVKDDF